MMDEDSTSIRPHQQMAQLSPDEKKFLLAVERGDVATSRRILKRTTDSGHININCADPLGRTGLVIAIHNENLEMIELMLEYGIETRDALLHAISEQYVEAVEVLLEHEDTIYKPGEPHSWESLPPDTATFTSDITPLILASIINHYEIIKLLLDRGATITMPHDIRCGCEECVTSRQEDSLRHSRSRINSYRALASPSLIALSSKDPILTAFELSWELRRLFFAEHEFKAEYMEIKTRMDCFATSLLDHTRGSYELEVLLNHDPTGPAFEHGERMHLNRLKLAIKFRQKQFVAHPNVQQLLASIWYEGLPGFRRKNMFLQSLEVIRIGLLFPFFSLCYIIAPHSTIGQRMRKPFIKFICHSASYFTFLFLLILASQRFESFVFQWLGSENFSSWIATDGTIKRGAPPSFVEWFILAWVTGLIWSEIKQLWEVGFQEYVADMWNILDFVTNSLYVATIALRAVAHYQVQKEKAAGAEDSLLREDWQTLDPMLIAEGLFAAANIFSSLKLVFIFSVNPYLGPLQISLGRMVMDIMKFFFLYILVLFAFSCGMNQLLWYYADLEEKRCEGLRQNLTQIERDPESCLLARRFSNLFEGSQSLFWAVFGLIELESFELAGIKSFTRFWGLLMFGCYSVINIVVLFNLLIAMMNHSYQLIFEKADIEWKFARSKLWISYFEEGGTVPPPFNIIPTPKTICSLIRWIFKKICRFSTAAKRQHIQTIRRKEIQQSERDIRYQNIMRNLVRRYVTTEQRQADHQGVTEDDVNEIKQDISAFRCELMDVLKNSGMKVRDSEGLGQGSGGKKNRQKERRLMKGFNISTATAPPSNSVSYLSEVVEIDSEQDPDTVHYDKRSPKTKLARLARMAGAKREMSKRKWGTIIEAARNAGMSKLVGRSRSEDSVWSNFSNPSGKRGYSAGSIGKEPGTTSRKTKYRTTDSMKYGEESSSQEQTDSKDSTGMSTLGRKKREKFVKSRGGDTATKIITAFTTPKVQFGKFRNDQFALSQSLDAGDVESKDSFEEVKCKRTSSAPTRGDNSSSPSNDIISYEHPKSSMSTSTKPIFTISSNEHDVYDHKRSEQDEGKIPKSLTDHIVFELEDEKIAGASKLLSSTAHSSPSSSTKMTQGKRPSSSHNPSILCSKLQGIQPIRTSNTSGWL